MYTMNPPDDEHIVSRNMQRNMTNVIKNGALSWNMKSNIDIFVDCNWVNTLWQWYSKHLHINHTQHNKYKSRTTQIATVQHNSNRTAQ